MDCKDCPFKDQVKVEGEGPDQCDLVVVGMAPAEQENDQGRVFVGVSGQILRRTLMQMGIQKAYLCNVFLCSITEDDKVKDALKCCRDVADEILLRKPKLVIALGDLPLKVLAPDVDYTIREIEGRIIPSRVGPLLPITHPAYYWRRPDEFFDFIECLRSGVKFLDGTYQQCIEPNLVEVTGSNLSEVRQIIGRHEYLAVDLETTGFGAYGWDPDSILDMGLAVDHETAYVTSGEMVKEFKDLLEEKKCIFWNAQFDCAFLKQVGITANNYFDGMLAHYTLDERTHSHGLKRVARIYLGADDWEKNIQMYLSRGKKSSYAEIPPKVRHEYLAKDVTRTYQLYEVLLGELNEYVFNTLLMPASRMFVEVENKGILIDPIKMINMGTYLEKDLENIEREIHDLSGHWINPNSHPQVTQYLYGELGLPIEPFYGYSADKNALAPYKDIPVVDKILEYRGVKKLSSTYIDGFAKFVDRSFRIHPTFKIFGTVTGRLSTERPSVMNIKKDSRLKEIFLPNPGHIIGSLDWKRVELVWYYLQSGDEELGALLQDPEANPHITVSEIAFGKERAEEMKGPAKAVVFGRLYGRGIPSIERQVGSEVMEPLMDAVDGLFPKIKDYSQGILRELRQKGYLDSYFQRRRRFPLITRLNRHQVEKQAINFPTQSPASDLNLLTLLHLYETYKDHGVWPLWCVHDSMEVDSPDVPSLEKVKGELEKYANELTGHKVPFRLDMDWGIDWSMRKEESDDKEEAL